MEEASRKWKERGIGSGQVRVRCQWTEVQARRDQSSARVQRENDVD